MRLRHVLGSLTWESLRQSGHELAEELMEELMEVRAWHEARLGKKLTPLQVFDMYYDKDQQAEMEEQE